MTGLKIVLPTTFSDTSLPLLLDDPVLSAGSLLLVDPMHSLNPWPAGVPADASTVPNLAWRQAATALGSGTQSSLASPFEKSSAITGSLGLVERSGKGGLHVLMSVTASVTSGQGVAVRFPQALIDWVVANPNHAYYTSVWFKGTRFGNVAGSVSLLTLASSALTTEMLFALADDGNNYPASGTKRTGYRRSRLYWRPTQDSAITPPFADNIIANEAVSGYTGTPATSGVTAYNNSKAFAVGYKGLFQESGTGVPSRIFYRAYFEDLTVSGRSYATVDALDFAEYTRQVLTVGGRYYGDTYTDPATIP